MHVHTISRSLFVFPPYVQKEETQRDSLKGSRVCALLGGASRRASGVKSHIKHADLFAVVNL